MKKFLSVFFLSSLSTSAFAIYCMKVNQVYNTNQPKVFSCIIKNHNGPICPGVPGAQWSPVNINTNWINVDVNPFPPAHGAQTGLNCCISIQFTADPATKYTYITDDSCESLTQSSKSRVEEDSRKFKSNSKLNWR